jgi:hypothetical protein
MSVMSKTIKQVTLFKPDGKTYTFYDAKSAYKNEKGITYIQPSDADEVSWGKLVTTDLPFILYELEA